MRLHLSHALREFWRKIDSGTAEPDSTRLGGGDAFTLTLADVGTFGPGHIR